MPQVSVDIEISASPEQVFDFLADLSLRPTFCDHYLEDYRLARANPVGQGAAASFLLATRVFAERAETAIVELDRPRRIVEEGRLGRRGRSRLAAVYELAPTDDDKTRVRLTTASEPGTAIDRLRQRGLPRWFRRQSKRALKRLRGILEDTAGGDLEHATIAGFEGPKAPRFGGRVVASPKAPPARS